MNTKISLIPGSWLVDNHVDYPDTLFNNLLALDYDKSMRARWTASFGKSYDYSGKTYPYAPMPDFLDALIPGIMDHVGFEPNNCLINLYHDGTSSMGYHSDNTDILSSGTGVVIISVGSNRTLRFKNKIDKDNIIDYDLGNGSLFYMNDAVQLDWLHSIPKSDAVGPRISLTFRDIR
jgi:alkylated DNA repair dioxygenase AlkB